MTATSVSVPRPGHAARPGLRTFRSPGFRMVVASLLLIVGGAILGSMLLHQATDPAGQFGVDFADYHTAAQRIAAGDSPYAPEMLAGPVAAQGTDRYRYPPPLAELLVPAAGVPMVTAAWIWTAFQAVAVFFAVWLAGTAGGAARTRERLLWTAVAAIWFLPVFDTLWKGNVSGFVALVVALAAVGGTAARAGTLAGAALKLVPATLLPSAFLPAPRRSWITAAIATAGVLAVSVALSPRAWADYATVLPNLLAGSADYATNLAPGVMSARLGAPPAATDILRLATLAGAGFAFAWSFMVARRPGGVPAAVVLGTVAMLLLPSALWYHYLVVLLPLAALAWPAASSRTRASLVMGGAIVSVALAWLPLAVLGGTVMIAATLRTLWPRPVVVTVTAE